MRHRHRDRFPVQPFGQSERRLCRSISSIIALLSITALFYSAVISTAYGSGKPLGLQDVIGLLRGGVFTQRVAQVVHDRGITFVPDKRNIRALRRAGADGVLLDAIKEARHVDAIRRSRRRRCCAPLIGLRVHLLRPT
jgi:hypothetical protein